MVRTAHSTPLVGIITVTGDSMIDDQIREGAWVVYEHRSNPRNGDTVVALIDGEEATLKRFYKEKHRIRLQPANDRYEPIYVGKVEIQGVVIGVIRRFQLAGPGDVTSGASWLDGATRPALAGV